MTSDDIIIYYYYSLINYQTFALLLRYTYQLLLVNPNQAVSSQSC